MHLHEFQELDRSKLIDLLSKSIDYEFLYICDQIKHDNCKNMKYFMNYFKDNKTEVPEGWTKLADSKLSTKEIVAKTTLIGILKGLKVSSNSEERWNISNDAKLFFSYQSVSEYKSTRYRYLKAVLDSALDENVQLLEFRRPVFGNVWYYENNGSISYISAEEELNELRSLKKSYIAKNPKFIDFSFIIFALRRHSNLESDKTLEMAIQYNKDHPDLVKGFDLVQEEDRGHSLLYHSDILIKAYNYGKNESNGTFQLYLHNAETNWAEDQLISFREDSVPTLENIYDAMVLEPRRLGHGLGYIKHPQIYETLIKKDIAIELCLASNHLLGYTSDVRTHPGLNYYRSGIPVVLAGDDPGTFGYNELTIEYYLASLAWSLNIYDLRNFASSSIQYSSLADNEKSNALLKWKKEWEKFIFFSYNHICNKFVKSFKGKTEITSILPPYSYFMKKANITLYGEGLESILCKNIICEFGEFQTNGYLSSINEIVCESPVSNQSHANLAVKILILDDAKQVIDEIDTKFNFSIIGN